MRSSNSMKLAATGRAVRLTWIEVSEIKLRSKVKVCIDISRYWRRLQSTSKPGACSM